MALYFFAFVPICIMSSALHAFLYNRVSHLCFESNQLCMLYLQRVYMIAQDWVYSGIPVELAAPRVELRMMYVVPSRKIAKVIHIHTALSIVTTVILMAINQRILLSEMVPNTTGMEPKFRDTTSCVLTMVLK